MMDAEYIIDWTFSVAPPIVSYWQVTSKSVGPFWNRRREHSVQSDMGITMEPLDDEMLMTFAKLPHNVLLLDEAEAERLGLPHIVLDSTVTHKL